MPIQIGEVPGNSGSASTPRMLTIPKSTKISVWSVDVLLDAISVHDRYFRVDDIHGARRKGHMASVSPQVRQTVGSSGAFTSRQRYTQHV